MATKLFLLAMVTGGRIIPETLISRGQVLDDGNPCAILYIYAEYGSNSEDMTLYRLLILFSYL